MGAIITPCATNGAIVNGEYQRIALVRCEHFDTGLPARLLLRKHKLAACEIFRGLAQEERDLKWKEDLTVQILVQAVEITGTVL
jgi:hypothetical protein